MSQQRHKYSEIDYITVVVTVHYRLMVVISESWHELSSTSSIRSPVVDEERMRPGHWLWLLLCVFFSALTVFWLDDGKDIQLVNTPFQESWKVLDLRSKDNSTQLNKELRMQMSGKGLLYGSIYSKLVMQYDAQITK